MLLISKKFLHPSLPLTLLSNFAAQRSQKFPKVFSRGCVNQLPFFSYAKDGELNLTSRFVYVNYTIIRIPFQSWDSSLFPPPHLELNVRCLPKNQKHSPKKMIVQSMLSIYYARIRFKKKSPWHTKLNKIQGLSAFPFRFPGLKKPPGNQCTRPVHLGISVITSFHTSVTVGVKPEV